MRNIPRNKLTNTDIATMIIVVVVLIVGLNSSVITWQNNIILKDDLDKIISNQQSLLTTSYLAMSSNKLLVENQKQFIPAIPTIHTTLSNVERMLNQTAPVILGLNKAIENATGQSLTSITLICPSTPTPTHHQPCHPHHK